MKVPKISLGKNFNIFRRAMRKSIYRRNATWRKHTEEEGFQQHQERKALSQTQDKTHFFYSPSKSFFFLFQEITKIQVTKYHFGQKSWNTCCLSSWQRYTLSQVAYQFVELGGYFNIQEHHMGSETPNLNKPSFFESEFCVFFLAFYFLFFY